MVIIIIIEYNHYNYNIRNHILFPLKPRIAPNDGKYREPRSFTWKQNSKLILDSVEEYAQRWAKKEDVEVDTLSEWVKSVMSLVNRRVSYSAEPCLADMNRCLMIQMLLLS